MIDLYCERVGASFWAEPINALTNLGFIIVGALAVYILSYAPARPPVYLKILAYSFCVIGVCSFTFHTFAQSWSMYANGVSIYLFQIYFLWCYQRYVLGLSLMTIVMGFVLFLLAVLVAELVPFNMNGSEIYLPCALMLATFSFLHKLKFNVFDKILLTASGLFVISLTLRSIDNKVCEIFTVGTHFAWHVLNAIVLFGCWLTLYFNYRHHRT